MKKFICVLSMMLVAVGYCFAQSNNNVNSNNNNNNNINVNIKQESVVAEDEDKIEVIVITTERIKSKKLHVTEKRQSATVSRNVYDKNGELFIAAGTPVDLEVTLLRERSVYGKPGHVLVTPVRTTDVKGNIVSLKSYGRESLGRSRREVAKKLTLSFIFIPPVNCLFLLIPGKHGVVPEGTLINSEAIINK